MAEEKQKRITNGNRCQITAGCLYTPGHKGACATRAGLDAEREAQAAEKKAEKQ